jgi:hypothetical protein
MKTSPAADRREIIAWIAIDRRGARVEKFGAGYRVTTPGGVDLLVSDIAMVSPVDLEPIDLDDDNTF